VGTSGQMSTSNTYVKYTISITQNWQDISGNYSNVTVSVRFFRTNTGYKTYGTGTVYCRINGTLYSASVSPSQKITNAGIELFNQNLNIGHNTDGSKYLETSAWISLNNPLTSSEQGYGEWLSTIPRNATCTDATNFNDEQNPTIYFTNPGNFDLMLKMEVGEEYYLITRDKVTRSSPYTFNLSETERNLLRARTPNSNSLTVRFTVGTYINGSISNWSYVDRTMTVVNANPIFSSSNVSYQDTNSSVVAITGNNQHIVRNQSNLSVSFTSASALKYATISKYQLTFNGATTEQTSSGTINYGLIDSGSDLTLTIKAIDSRGNFMSVSKTVTMFDWLPPTAIITANRKNNYEDESYLKVNASISSVNSKNALEFIKYRYKKTSDSTYSSYVTIQNNTQYTISINKLYAWYFQVLVTDKFGNTTYNFVLAKGTPIMFFDTEKLSVGVNCFPSKLEALEVNGKTIFEMIYPVGSIYMTISSTNPSSYFGGTWVSWGSGKIPVGVNTAETEFNTVEKTGGSKTVALTSGQLPAHQHAVYAEYGTSSNLSSSPIAQTYMQLAGSSAGTRSYQTSPIASGGGNGESHSNLQPYITCYMWKRTA